ncbi:unnamed protein product [Rotaria magnacalcarata]|uniref:LTD domain-containing protein n=1 Tax=Rotaria magnacalcarata TaxID=392030 RepID=A0A815M9H1_9BILA|nr:unnamed protein product [Rotaria magnacalcarata]CAF4094314.1 unnamed protein product [Rotaria magnacalcarata]CAF4249582.1 unnamed protein product [Rotaria magnacalcarata]
MFRTVYEVVTMSLDQSYSMEPLSLFGSYHRIHDSNILIAQIVNDLTGVKQQDVDEKLYFHSLNNRLEDLLHYLYDLKSGNKNLSDDLKTLIANESLVEENCGSLFQELDSMILYLSEENHCKTIEEIEIKSFDEQTELTNRIQTSFLDILNSYNEKHRTLFYLINQLDNDLNKIHLGLGISNDQIKSYGDDYREELIRFSCYLSEWTQMALDRQHLLNEIQLLKKHHNLRLRSYQEEINEWNRLLNSLLQESRYFHQNSLETMKQQLQIDYEQMLKEQQTHVEIVLTRKFKSISNKIYMNLDERQYQEHILHFENLLDEHTKEYDSLESDYRILAEKIQHKRWALVDLENQAKLQARRRSEQHARLEHDINLALAEYYELKDQLDQLIYTIRFDIDQELKIYEVLLNSLYQKENDCLSQNGSNLSQLYRPSITRTADIDHTLDFRRSSMLRDNISITLDENISRDQYETQKNTIDQSQMVKMPTARSFAHEMSENQQKCMNMNQNDQESLELDENYIQSIVHCKRKYKGKIIIKIANVQGGFVEIENIGNRLQNLTGWLIERIVDGRRISYTFPEFQLGSNKTVRIYGKSYYQNSLSTANDSDFQLIATNFHDWDTGQHIRTELFNCNHIVRALFEQTADY